jgi:hypothetical protein
MTSKAKYDVSMYVSNTYESLFGSEALLVQGERPTKMELEGALSCFFFRGGWEASRFDVRTVRTLRSARRQSTGMGGPGAKRKAWSSRAERLQIC